MPTVSVSFYARENGTEPAREFLLSLDKKMRARVFRTIALLERNGSELREPYSRPLGDGIFELRCQSGTDRARILYFFFHGGNAILTNGFVKKTQKTPRNEYERARRYRDAYLVREERHDAIQRLS